MLKLGWFSTGRGEGSLGLLRTVQDAIASGELPARMEFVFSNREPGEAEGSDRFFRQVRDFGTPLVTLSSQRFRREQGGGPFSRHRANFDREVMRLLEPYNPDVSMLAGYMLITAGEMCNLYTMLNIHPALPGGPVGTWQDVIWDLIAQGGSEAGAYVHLATEDLDRGPVLTYCSFPVRGSDFDELWRLVEGHSVEELKATEGEELLLFRRIREEGVRRERPLVVETLKAFAAGLVGVVDGLVLDWEGKAIQGLCLNEEIENSIRDAG
ncbi:MAG: formyltransferase family protein [Chloroflexota bacterium]|nr:formyltransferase family protein [Chloroflexota bacterium]MDE2941018.1 formyltransferase family protein [Chloroflexota bacterium]MDE3268214.1 formyltransferase family protein [Chloroflexota bacterium]